MPDFLDPDATLRLIVLVTGLSGAGRSTALHALEDMGYDAIDNLPLRFLPSLIESGDTRGRPIAVGIDSRTDGFDPVAMITLLNQLEEDPRLDARLIYVEADDETLVNRYGETRRRHPLAEDRPLISGIAVERTLLAPVRERAFRCFDTTRVTLGQFKAILENDFSLRAKGKNDLRVFLMSFGFRHGLPRDANLVFDVRFLRNPFYEPDLRDLTGLDSAVETFVKDDPGWSPFIGHLSGLLDFLLPRYRLEGKSTLTIALGCTGGRHRSVTVVRSLARWLETQGTTPYIFHRDISGAKD